MIKNSVFILTLVISSFGLAQLEGYPPINSIEDIEGVWITIDSSEIKLFEDEFAPIGKWLIIDDEKSYFSAYIDPDWGASIDVEFDYSLNSNIFDCRLTGSNSLGYYMQHENEPFGFKLYFKVENGETHLKLTNDFGTTYELIPAT
ncbi:MAG: hypothetical protein P8P74_18710 [Crocinitomicaceae bacterium]|nr:hypothetical protein [Crocinitomicaceae bacterium]